MNESTLVPREEMNDLDWLARNVHVWPCGKHQPWCYVVTKIDGERTWASNVLSRRFPYSLVDKDKWLARRAELQNKPSWGKHGWPQIFQNEDGHWFGARAEWDFKAHISGGWKGDGVSLLRDDGEYLQSGTILGDWRSTLEKRPEQAEFEPFVSVEDAKISIMQSEGDVKHSGGIIGRSILVKVDAATAKQQAPKGSGNPILGMVLADLTNRALEGKEKYGEPLLANNGRNPLWDAYQEALDLAMYLRQAIEEQK